MHSSRLWVALVTSERNYRVLTACLAALAASAVAYSVLFPGPAPLSTAVIRDGLILAVLGVIAEEMAVEVSDHVTLTAGNLPILLAVMYTGRLPAMLVALLVGLWGFWRENSRAVAAYNAANFVVSAFLALLAFDGIVAALGVSLQSVSVGLLAAGAAVAAVFEATNLAVTSVGMYVKYGKRLRAFWREQMPPFLRSLAMLALLGLVVAALYAKAGIIAVVLLFVPLLASQYMFKLLVPVSYTHLRAHETRHDLVCRLLLE